jgi:hypothetical protein
MSDTYFATIFPDQELTSLSNQPLTQATRRILHQEINANATAVRSARGNGLLRHYAMVTEAATYTAEEGVEAFAPPVHRGNTPAKGANAAAITEANRQFLAAGKENMLYANTDKALKKLILQAVPTVFTQKLKDERLGYANVTTLQLLTHLDTTYGTITIDDLDRNLTEMNKPWNLHNPIEALYHMFRTCITFAAATDPISEATAVRVGLQLIEMTKGFTDAIRDWRKKALADRTLDNFEIHFTAANVERNRTLTVRVSG